MVWLGILLRNGYWFDIEQQTWEQKRFPPYANVVAIPDAMWTFRKKPTIFGNTVCDGLGNCEFTGVEQYDVTTNKWIHIGKMIQTRTFHEVVEVPVSFCDFSSNSVFETDTAAMIIGGIYNIDSADNPDNLQEMEVLSSVEIYGCPGLEDTMVVEDLPYPTYMTGAESINF